MIKLSRWMKAATLLTLVLSLFPLAARATDGLVALTPRPNEHVTQSPKVVSIEVAGKATVDRSAVHMVVDGRDVSDAITTTRNVVQYKPPQPLSAGEHAVEVSVTDAAGGKLSYTWTFTVDGGATQSAQRASASSADNAAAAPSNAGDANAASQESDDNSGYGASVPQTINGQQNFYGGFYPIGGGPYYWGDNAEFEFMGIPGGFGFLTFTGIPGVFDLLPLGLNTFYAIVPIPVGFVFGPPFVTCHFFTPGGGSTVSVLPSFPVVHHRRLVTEPVAHTPFTNRSSTTSSTTTSAQRLLHTAPSSRNSGGTHTMPHFNTSQPGHSVMIHPVATHPITHLELPRPVTHFETLPRVTTAPVHISTAPATVHITAPAVIQATTRVR